MNYSIPLAALVLGLTLLFIFRKKIFGVSQVHQVVIHEMILINVTTSAPLTFNDLSFEICNCGATALHGYIKAGSGKMGPFYNKIDSRYWTHRIYKEELITEKQALDLIVLIDKSALDESAMTFT